MPFKDKKKQADAQRQYYLRNKVVCNARTRKRQDDWAKWSLTIKSKLSCSGCDESHPRCLDFHHLDPDSKVDMIARMVRNCVDKEKILEEMAKCIILCTNCHRKLDYEQTFPWRSKQRPN